MSLNVKYGISKVQVEDEEHESTFIKFGDGRNRILDANWDDEHKGIVICRDVECEAFHQEKYPEGTTTSDFQGEKVFIVFDNNKSIDVMIKQLEHIRDNL